VLAPRQAEEFFHRAGAAVTPANAEVALLVDGMPVRITSTDGNFFLTLAGQTVPLNPTADPLRPVAEALPLLPFDLLFPFFRWEEVHYDGPTTALGRAVQRFTAASSGGWTVRVWLDAKCSYPLRWDLYGPAGELCRRFRLRSVVKTAGGEWGMGLAQIIPMDGRTVTIVPGGL
jgi:hypothetical protein